MNRGAFKPIDEAKREAVIEAFRVNPDALVREVSALAGVSMTTVCNIRKDTGLPVRRITSKLNGRTDLIKALLAEGHNPDQIAQQLGVSPKYLRDQIRKYGIGGNALVMRQQGRSFVDSTRPIKETVYAMCAAADGLHRVFTSIPSLPKETASELLRAMEESRAAAATSLLYDMLKEICNDGSSYDHDHDTHTT